MNRSRLRLAALVCSLVLAGCPSNDDLPTGDLASSTDLTGVDLRPFADDDLATNTGEDMTIADPDLAAGNADLASEPDLSAGAPDMTVSSLDLRSTDLAASADLRPYRYRTSDLGPNTVGDFVITYIGTAAQIATSDSIVFSFIVRNQSGNPVVGLQTQLALPVGWSILTEALETDLDGQAYFSVYAGPVPGTYPITISGPGVEPVTFEVTAVAPAAGTVLPLVNWALVNPDATMAATLPRPAIDNPMLGPYGIAPDAAGGYFFPDLPQHRIFHVDAAGTLTLVAGTGVNTSPNGVIVDGMMATDAPLYGPRSLAYDGTNQRLYFLDDTDFEGNNQYNPPLGSHRVRMIDLTTGTISTVAGGTSADPLDVDALAVPLVAYHLAVDPATSTLAIADRGNESTPTHRIRLISGGVASVLRTSTATCNALGLWNGCTGSNQHCPIAWDASGQALFVVGNFCSDTGSFVTKGAMASIARNNGQVSLLNNTDFDGRTVLGLSRSSSQLVVSTAAPAGIYRMQTAASSLVKVIGGGGIAYLDYAPADQADVSGFVLGAMRTDGRLVFSVYDDAQAYAGVRVIW